jgi:hypothetical protein
MIQLKKNRLSFSFQEVHPKASFNVDFQRTLRIPDDEKDYPLPPGLGRFPVRHVDDFADNIAKSWMEHGGVMLPMYQSEALWLNFDSRYIAERQTGYPFAVKVAAGKINAVTGDPWTNWLQRDPQDYMVSHRQPWLDGYCVEKGTIRQFVAMPLGSGYSAEEQITGDAQYGGVQIIVYPMKKEAFERLFPKVKRIVDESRMLKSSDSLFKLAVCGSPGMGLAAGGRMKQEIYEDPFDLDDWDMNHSSRCFVHIANSLVWRAITGKSPPTTPYTAKEYTNYGLPWFEYYSDNTAALNGSEELEKLKSVAEMAKDKGEVALPENESVDPKNIVKLREGLVKGQVREGSF